MSEVKPVQCLSSEMRVMGIRKERVCDEFDPGTPGFFSQP
jgi:hypothetical protein